MADRNICMTKKSAVDEHEKLVRVLRSGSKAKRKAEAKDQARELARYKKRGSGRR